MVIPATSGFGFRHQLDTKEFQAFCISLANEIDGAVGNNKVPGNVQELALTLGHVCRRRCDDQTKAVVMMLMLSVKSACQVGWFPQRETQQLLYIIDLMLKDFSSIEDVVPSVTPPFSLIPKVIERFYPFLKLGNILFSFEAKPESNPLVKDFHITEKMPLSPTKMLGLFVVGTEDISKSNCIIHPQEVSFLLNGRGIEKRVNISMDSGPQLPTNVTGLLNVGANLLQTMGCFGGTYLIVIAFMEVLPLLDRPLLENYVHAEVTESNSDCDIIEGPSRISLNCPISRTRIKFPVKGHVCKHLQCFDFWNYVNMNMRRPSWRCPHCNQSVCYTDIRVDQKMIKILEEVGDNAESVIISADWSWTVVTETEEKKELTPETTHEHGDLNSMGPNVLDLTRDENEMDTPSGTQAEEHISLPIDSTMLNQFSAPINALPQTSNGQHFNLPQLVDIQDSAAIGASRMSSSPLDRFTTNTFRHGTSMPVAQPSQFQGSHSAQFSRFQESHVAQFSQYQGSHVVSHEHRLGRISGLVERLNHFQGSSTNQIRMPFTPPLQHHYPIQNQTLSTRSLSFAQQRPMTSSVRQSQAINFGGTQDQRMPSSTYTQNLAFNSGGIVNQRSNQDGTMGGQFSSRELMNMTSTDPTNWRPTRMRGSIRPGSTVYDNMIIRPTRPVQTQPPQTLPLPQPTPYNNTITDEIQAFLEHPSYPTGDIETRGEGVGLQGSFWSTPPEAW